MRTKFTKQQIGATALNQSRQAPAEEVSPTSMETLGVAGAKVSSGFVHDEFIIRLVGERGRRVYREMRDNDATVGAIMFGVEMLLRAVEWRVEYKGSDIEASTDGTTDRDESTDFRTIEDPEDAISFLEGVLFDDMSHTWDDFISNVLTMLTFGWQYSEICWKRRNGLTDDPMTSSIFDDGMIGLAKLADRSQETLERWDVDEIGQVYGMWQQPPNGIAGGLRYIPRAKALHFRPHAHKDSPEGRSVLRNSYRSWWFLKNIQEVEAIAIERELNGLPVVSIPNAILNGTSAEDKAAVALYTSLVRDIKFNDQAGVVIPSDPFYDSNADPTNLRQVELKLLTADGTRAIDTDKVAKRYQGDIARTILAQFILLSQSGNRGGFAQSKNESDLFLRACEGWLESVASQINRDLIPKIWAINGLSPEIMPYVAPGDISPKDLENFGNFIQKIAAAGVQLFDTETQNYIREIGGLPLVTITEENEDELIFDNGDDLNRNNQNNRNDDNVEDFDELDD